MTIDTIKNLEAEIEELERCPYCGITAESVCDSLPASMCEKALNHTYGDPCRPFPTESAPHAE